MYYPVKYIIFDLDGTILDTEKIFLEAYGRLLKRYGKSFPEDVQRKCIGKNKTDLHAFLINEYKLQNKTIDELAEEGSVIQNEIYETRKIDIMPGAQKLVSHMAMNHIQMGIATASPRNHVRDVTKYHPEFFQLFDHIITAEPGVLSKPEPDIFLISARRFIENPDPKDFLVFEDTPTGVAAGIAAGMQVIMIPHYLVPKEQTLQATKVLNSLLDFIPEEFGLPAYEQRAGECED